jgi:Ser/Thr protein kinase RdoA (MazF antagonist)
MSTTDQVRAVALHFQFAGAVREFAPYGNGHINDTYLVTCDDAGATMRYVLQHINRHVFHDPIAVMENIERVTAHLAAQAEREPDEIRDVRRVPRLIATREGRGWHVEGDGETWRAYRFVDGTRAYETAETEKLAFESARAFGRFQQQLASLPPPRLKETIPDFHHTPKRFEALQKAVDADVARRVALAGPEIDFALAHEAITGVLLAANLPERTTHNDTKLNNVLFDETTGEGVCVIDLDTVMPGLALYDFGDMVRTTTSVAAEDERDLSKVEMQFGMFEALVRGYLDAAGAFLTKEEREFLAFSGKLITFEVGIRFLTDFLSGDTYFKVHREGQNLDRCRAQFKLVESIERQEEAMNGLVRSIAC